MPRPPCCRRVSGEPVCVVFRPAGGAGRHLQQVTMTLDEYEAVRLADLEGLYQEQAAERMSVSRPTFGRILSSAHRKVAEALVGGKVLRIEGGQVACEREGRPRCEECQREWDGVGARPERCSRCQCPARSEMEKAT
jgi:uncharacterized protein